MIDITKLVAIKEISNTDENEYRTFTIDIKYGVEDGYYTADSPIKVAVLSREEKTTNDSGTCIITRTKDTSIREATIDGETTPLIYVNNLRDDGEVIHILEALANKIRYRGGTNSTPVSAHQADTTDTNNSDDLFEVEAKWNEDIKLDKNGKVPAGTVLGHVHTTLRDDIADTIKHLSNFEPGYGLRYDKDNGATIVAL